MDDILGDHQVRKSDRGVHDNEQSLDRVESGMRRWRREFPEINCSGKAIVGRILHLQEVFLIAINEALAPHGLKYPEFAVLATLRVEGAPFKMSPKALLDSLILTSGGLSNLLRKLEQRGLIRRHQDAIDRRGVIVELTALGRRRVEPAMRVHAQTELALLSGIKAPEDREMTKALSTLMCTTKSVADARKASPSELSR